jgi:ABC-type uncharacterized transport system involved in gliding motility auxiliary subunit
MRKLKDKINIWLFCILVAGNLFLFNSLISNWNKARLDLTENKEHSLSSYTKKVIRNLPDRVEVHGIFTNHTHQKLKPLIPQIKDILHDYESESNGKIKVVFQDPSTNKAMGRIYEEYQIKPKPIPLESKYKKEIKSIYFDLIIKYGDQSLKFSFDELIEVEEISGSLNIKLKNLELVLTKGIQKVTSSFTSIESVMTSITTPVHVVYYKLPKSIREQLKKQYGEKELKALDEKLKESQKKVEAISKKYKLSFKIQDMVEGFEPGDILISYGNKKITFSTISGNVPGEEAINEKFDRNLKRILPGFTKSVGFATPIPKTMRSNPMMGQYAKPQREPDLFDFLGQILQSEYKLERVDLNTGSIPSVDVLLIVAPENYSEKAVYALDQYIMLGGRVVILADTSKINLRTSKQGSLVLDPVKSGLEGLLSSWGVVIEDKILADVNCATIPVPKEVQPGLMVLESMEYRYFPKFRYSKTHPIVAGLPEIVMLWPGALSYRKASDKIQMKPILNSSSKSWLTETGSSFLADFSKKITPPVATKSHILAMALTGKFDSFFKGKSNPVLSKSTNDATGKSSKKVNRISSPETRIVIIADADFVSNIGKNFAEKQFETNFGLLKNSIEWVSTDEKEFLTSQKGLPRPLKTLSDSKKSSLQHTIWIFSLLLLTLAYLLIAFLRRRGA